MESSKKMKASLTANTVCRHIFFADSVASLWARVPPHERDGNKSFLKLTHSPEISSYFASLAQWLGPTYTKTSEPLPHSLYIKLLGQSTFPVSEDLTTSCMNSPTVSAEIKLMRLCYPSYFGANLGSQLLQSPESCYLGIWGWLPASTGENIAHREKGDLNEPMLTSKKKTEEPGY